MDVLQHTCVQCSKNFSNISNLRKHVKKFHPEKGDYLASLQLKKNKKYNFACDKCHKRFMHLKHLRYHAKTHGGLSDNTPNIIPKRNRCAMCNNFCADKKTIVEHYRQFHSISIEHKKLVFQTEEEFVTWKLTFENETNSKYVVESRKSYKTHILTDFVCHRSGRYVPEGKNIRNLKRPGSNKINALCPASIKMKKLNNCTCEVTIIDKHVGHTNDIGHLNLSRIERESLAAKIASKVPFEDILDEIKNSTDSELKRLHLLTKKDLYNIETCFNLRSLSVRHKNDVVINKGKHSSKLQLIQSRHKNSLSLREDLIVQCEIGWNVASETTTEFYSIQKIKEECDCELLCDECKICIHQFCCSCLDSSIKYNMCEHIHLLIRYITNIKTASVTDTLGAQKSGTSVSESNLIIVKEEPDALKAQAHLKELSISSKSRTASFASKKQRVLCLLEELQHNVRGMTSEEELNIVDNALVPIKHTLAALKHTKGVQIKTNHIPKM